MGVEPTQDRLRPLPGLKSGRPTGSDSLPCLTSQAVIISAFGSRLQFAAILKADAGIFVSARFYTATAGIVKKTDRYQVQCTAIASDAARLVLV